ncbi:metal-sulfur cluster assembly factor [Candidatus Bipolaricaulota bacterium]|nr:metal-sulfur cluster assembly factor [Candidatus Bipolaricaulota bacterium]
MVVPREKVVSALETVVDPEMGINIVDLGLIYEITSEEGQITVEMTLTTPRCPLAGMIAAEAEQAVRTIAGREDRVEVVVVWDPPWTPDRMSDEARRQFG